jgi:pyruvate/2-oxoacid:ferredoxin oxidoreductase beta subunit
MAMSYKHVYVAQIALGANPMKAIQALKEAESYNGPSLVICYCPCVNQGIKGGLVNSIKEEKDAVACGYFTTFRYDPRLLEQGKPALQLDCPEPDFTKLRDFVMHETRFSQFLSSTRITPKNSSPSARSTRKAAGKTSRSSVYNPRLLPIISLASRRGFSYSKKSGGILTESQTEKRSIVLRGIRLKLTYKGD